ncbi:MAG: Crp/Fnr family transcriptional regulator [Magnetovibrio sp.]|nr:Crp/Fnr family transcriptional regulator [Magnetovibrio sp.]
MSTDSMIFLENLTVTGRTLIQQRLVRKSFTKGSQVIEKGDSVSGAYFVLKGSLRVFTLSPEGKQATLYRMDVGDTCVLALNSLFNDVLYPAWVEADQDTTIGVIPSDAYRTLFGSETVIQDITMRALSSAVFGLMSELEVRHVQSLDQRLARYLLMRASSDGKVHNTQQEIASEIGTTREVVGRLMVQFTNRGLIKTGRGVVTLLNKPGLRSA